MSIPSKNRLKRSASGKFVLGSGRFSKISAVEGIKRTRAMKKRAKNFDDQGLSVAQRRAILVKIYRKKA